jgi:mediator of RNA polymerase II transcription subunit 17
MGRKHIVSALVYIVLPACTKEIVRNFRVIFDKDFAIHSSAYRLDRTSYQLSLLETYTPETSISLVAWLQELLEKTILES